MEPIQESPELYRTLGKIETKIDSLVDTFKTHTFDDANHFNALNKAGEKQDDRLSGLEKKIYMATGALAAVQFLLAYVTKFH